MIKKIKLKDLLFFIVAIFFLIMSILDYINKKSFYFFNHLRMQRNIEKIDSDYKQIIDIINNNNNKDDEPVNNINNDGNIDIKENKNINEIERIKNYKGKNN
ncbi:MAG: hypothetical protein N3A58_03275 [Spirochaetes bacterium]|nr:hypothetical protein [Spirochaetota bacterium]